MTLLLETLTLLSYVLVPSGATLYARPDPSAPELNLAFGWNSATAQEALQIKRSSQGSTPAPEPSPPPPTAVMELVGSSGDYLAVRPVSWNELGAHCAAMLGELANLDVTLYVHRTQLVPVITKPVRRTFSDDTWLVLTPGVPVTQAAPGRYWANARGVPLVVQLDESAIGIEYAAPTLFLAPQHSDYQLVTDSPAHYGEDLIRDLHGMFARGAGAALFTDVEQKGAAFWGTVRGPCAALRVRTDPGGVLRRARQGGEDIWQWADGRPFEPESADRVDSFEASAAIRTNWDVTAPAGFGASVIVKKGTVVRLPGGLSGSVRDDLQLFEGEGWSRQLGAETCVRPRLSASPSDTLRFCFETGSSKQGGRLGSASGSSDEPSKPPKIRLANASVQLNGADVSEDIRTEVLRRLRQNFGRFRFCYEKGLADNPKLAGKVVLRFGIDAEGGVQNVTTKGSNLPHKVVVDCTADQISGLEFPTTAAGATVVYTLELSPPE